MSLHPDPVESVAFWPLPQGPSGLGTRLGLFSCLSALRPCWSVAVGGPEECCYPAVCVGWGTRTSAKGLPGGLHLPGLEGEAMEAGQPPFPGRPCRSLWLMLQPDLTLVPPQAAVTKAQPPHPSRRSTGQYLAPEAAGPEAAEAASGRHPPHCE